MLPTLPTLRRCKGPLSGGDRRVHLAGERLQARQRAHHHGDLVDQPLWVESQEIDPLRVSVADPGGEDQSNTSSSRSSAT